jgi:hypothetical protein
LIAKKLTQCGISQVKRVKREGVLVVFIVARGMLSGSIWLFES